MEDLRLPDALIAFLMAGRQLEYESSTAEPGRITLKPLENLYLGSLDVDSRESPLADSDPRVGQEGYYAVPAVDLIASADGEYPAEGILIWLPDSQVFGTWDCDHADLRVFPGVTWSTIVRNPVPYINAQWRPDQIPNEFFVPWPDCDFRTDHAT
jgi:hypothetical protein